MQATFFRSRRCGSVLAWPLHSPASARFGHWSWVELTETDITFVRAAEPAEIEAVLSRYMVWGRLISKEPWAIVYGRPGQSSLGSRSAEPDARTSIGV